MAAKEEKQVEQILNKLTLRERLLVLLKLHFQGKIAADAKLRDCLQSKCEPRVFVVG